MRQPGRYNGTLRTIYAQWPLYLFGYGGGALLALAVIYISAPRGWWSFVLLAFLSLSVLAYFFIVSLWAAYTLEDKPAERTYDVLFDLGQLQPTDHFVQLNLGERRTALGLARRLTTGHLTVIDIYNPQLTPGRTLARTRHQALARRPQPDPRLSWRDGSIHLLPLPDASVKAVTLNQVALEFWQEGDRLLLLKEIYRVLVPGGRVLLAERVRTQTNLLVMGPAALSLPSVDYWRELLETAGFQVKRERDMHDLIHCFRADKPTPTEVRQLPLDLGF